MKRSGVFLGERDIVERFPRIQIERRDGFHHQTSFDFAADGEEADVAGEHWNIVVVMSAEFQVSHRRHACSRHASLERLDQVIERRLGKRLGRLEFEAPTTKIARVRAEQGGGRSESITGHSVALRAVLAVESALGPALCRGPIASHRPGGSDERLGIRQRTQFGVLGETGRPMRGVGRAKKIGQSLLGLRLNRLQIDLQLVFHPRDQQEVRRVGGGGRFTAKGKNRGEDAEGFQPSEYFCDCRVACLMHNVRKAARHLEGEKVRYRIATGFWRETQRKRSGSNRRMFSKRNGEYA